MVSCRPHTHARSLLLGRAISFAALVLLLFVGCASTVAPPIEQGFSLDEDESRLWDRSADERKRLERSGLLHEDEDLALYVTEVALRVQPQNTRTPLPLSVKILRDPRINAFALPDGTIYLHTGMLARMENEAQLATVLGHEMAHVFRRHALLIGVE